MQVEVQEGSFVLRMAVRLEQTDKIREFFERLTEMGAHPWGMERIYDNEPFDRIQAFIREQTRIGAKDVAIVCDEILIALVDGKKEFVVFASDHIRIVRKAVSRLVDNLTAVKAQLRWEIIQWKTADNPRRQLHLEELTEWINTLGRVAVRLKRFDDTDFHQALIDSVKEGTTAERLQFVAIEALGFGD